MPKTCPGTNSSWHHMFLPCSSLSQPTCLLICVYLSDLPHSITASPIAWSGAMKISLPIMPAVMALFHLGPGRPHCYTPTQTIGHVSLLKTQSTVLRIVISQTLELLSLEVCVNAQSFAGEHLTITKLASNKELERYT